MKELAVFQTRPLQRREQVHPLGGLHRWADGLALVVLAAWAWHMGSAYLTDNLFVWGDNPGQFMRLWYPLTVSWPRFLRVVDWNPLWYAGYPELQFYPPGFVLLGLAIHTLTFGQLSPFATYNTLLFLALVLPAFTSYAFLRAVLNPLGPIPAIAGSTVAALFTLGFAPQWGGTNAIPIGLVGERLAFGTVPLVWLAGLALAEHLSAVRLAVAAGLLAWLAILHPFHAPAAVLWVGLYALARAKSAAGRRRPLSSLAAPARRLALWGLAALGLTAWWLLPLLAHREYAAPLVRATLPETLRWLRADEVPLLARMAVPAVAGLTLVSIPRLRAALLATWGTLFLLVGTILGVHLVLIQRLSFFLLDPVRFVAEYYLALMLLGGAALALVVHWGLRRRWVLLAVGLAFVSQGAVALAHMWPNFQARAHPSPRDMLAGTLAHPAFDGLWTTLQEETERDGRILFTSYYTYLYWPDGSRTPTAIKAMTPFFTGREIVGGTFSHWSPVARLLWVGDPWAAVLPERVEREDGQSFLGRPWAELNADELYALVRALNVTTVVADADDFQARQFLDAAPTFHPYWNNGFFYLYRVLPPASAWVEGHNATVRLLERTPHRWRVQVERAADGAWLRAKMTAYPLWEARLGSRRVPLEPDEYALARVSLPAGTDGTLTLTYRPGLAERAGQLITAFCALLLAAAAGRELVRQMRRT